MKYPCYSLAQGRQVLANIRSEQGPSSTSHQAEIRQAQIEIVGLEIDDLLRVLEKRISREAAEKLKAAGMSKDEVEAALAIDLFSELQDLPGQILTDTDFWRYLSVEILRPFVFWRDGENCTPASFGLNSFRRIPDCVPLRMFNRVHIARKALGTFGTDEILSFSRSAGTDFWQSHVFRVKNRFDPPIVRFLVSAANQGLIPNIDVMREVAKLIKQLRANIDFRWLGQPELHDLLSSAVAEAKEILASQGLRESKY